MIKSSSLTTKEFEKSIRGFNEKRLNSLKDKIKELHRYEDNYSLLPDGCKSAEDLFGKRLKKLNKDTYCIENGYDRALAYVVEKDGKKIFVWFWAGSHEDYNKKLNINYLNKNNNQLSKNLEDDINDEVGRLLSMPNEIAENVMKQRMTDRRDYQKKLNIS